MQVEKVATIVPVDDLGKAVKTWSELLGVDPTFVDGDRWAQFDIAATRISLAGADRTSDEVSVMLKVTDLDYAHSAAQSPERIVGDIEVGPHERRFQVTEGSFPPVIFYSPTE